MRLLSVEFCDVSQKVLQKQETLQQQHSFLFCVYKNMILLQNQHV